MRSCGTSIRAGVAGALVVLALAAGGAGTAPAQIRYDESFAGFGYNGVVIRSGYPMGPGARGMVVQPDGKIVTAGYTSLGILVLRFLPDGHVDPTFGNGAGVAAYLHPTVQTRATCVALQADGKIVVAGWANTGPANYMVARLTADGHLDPSFGSGGWVLTDIADDTDQAYAVVVQADGKIIAAGRSLVGNDYDFSAVRYNPDGSLDTTFNGDGKVTFGYSDIGPDNNEACYDAALDGSGRLVMVGGGTDVVTTGVFKMARLTTSGYLDTSFNQTGKKQFDIGTLDNAAQAVAIAPDGKIVVVGSTDSYPHNESLPAYVARINADGTFDNSFDGDGKLQASDHFTVRDVAVRPDGSILMVGEYQTTSGEGILWVKSLNADGSQDLSFRDGSDFGYNSTAGFCTGYAMALLPDGRAVVYGARNNDHLLLRIWPQGHVDVGRQQGIGFPGWTQATAYGMVVQPDDKLVVAGTVANVGGTESDIGVARLLPDGGYDNTFGASGRTTFPYDEPDDGFAVALQTDGKIVVAGDTVTGTDHDFLLVRFNADGSLDGTFGFLGFAVLDFLGGDDYGTAVAIAPDGKIVVAGTAVDFSGNKFAVARFTSSGAPDPTFDGDGKRTITFTTGLNHWASGVAVRSDNRILVGGTVGGDFALVQLNGNGSLDTTFGSLFGGSGMRTYDLGGNDFLNALTLRDNGQIYAAGSSETAGHTVVGLLQLPWYGAPPVCFPTPCGTWDQAIARIDVGTYGSARALDVRTDGQVLAAGNADAEMFWSQLGSGQDPTPIVDTVDLPGTGETASGVRFLYGGKLVVASTYTVHDTKAMVVSRYYADGVTSAVGDPDPLPAPARFIDTYPNPMSGRTRIGFALAGGAPTRVTIYDVAGRRVRELVDGSLGPGEHAFDWDATDDRGRRVAAGVYLVRLESGEVRASRKIIVLRP